MQGTGECSGEGKDRIVNHVWTAEVQSRQVVSGMLGNVEAQAIIVIQVVVIQVVATV